MSFEEFDISEDITIPAKKRRIQRACDACRQKRRACDALRSSTRKCSFCSDHGIDCTYSGAPTTTKRPSYTQVLEARLELTEKLLRKLSPESISPGTESSEWSKDSPVMQHGKTSGAAELAAMSIRAINEREPAYRTTEDVDDAHLKLAKAVEQLELDSHRESFMGKSSGAMLLKTALDLKQQYTASDGPSWGSRRKEYWAGTPWAKEVNRPRYVFPSPDLLSPLVGLYFEHNGIYIPLLHRPTFERALADNVHLRDDKFAANLLLVCAIASRFSDDPRVFADAANPLSSGWQYFSQIALEVDLYSPPTLYDLQRYCLAIQFLEASAVPQGTWALVGIGIRMAQEVGAHRRQTGPHTVEAELWRRAFWVLISYDRTVSCALGRPCAMQYDDFDVEMPTECDDEYWEHKDPAHAFRQPPGKPSRVAFFNSFLRLGNILAFVLHLIYSLDKTKNLFAAGDQAWEEHIVAELDSALNKWVDRIPAHLQWDPHRADPVFFNQSVVLYVQYYYVQMTTHRPFIPMVREGPTRLPSLAICTNAARSCCRVVDVWHQRMEDTRVVIPLPALTTAGVILLLNVWSGKRTGLAPHMNTTIEEVYRCMQAIQVLESRWQMAGIYWDILNELATVGQVSLPARVPAPDSTTKTFVNRRKRTHSVYGVDDEDAPRTRTHVLETPVAPAASDPRTLPATHFVEAETESFAWVGALDALPMYGADLGRMPIFPAYPAPPPENVDAPYSPVLERRRQYDSPWASVPRFPPPASLTIATAVGRQEYQSATTSGSGSAASQDEGGIPLSPEDIRSMIDNDAIAMWVNAPTSLGAGDWGTYFSIMGGLSQEQPPS